MASKCTIQVKQVLEESFKGVPVVGKLVNDYLSGNIGRLLTQTGVKAEETYTTGAAAALQQAALRFTRQEELPQDFIRPGDIPIKAETGKIYKREAQQAAIMNQYGLAEAYARIAGLQRKIKPTKAGIASNEGVNLFVKQLDLGDAVLRSSGIPLSTVKAGALKGQVHTSYLTFGDVMKIFLNQYKQKSIAKFFLRSADGTKNVQSQNLSEAVRRILEHGETFGKIDLEADYEILKAQVLDALRNPSGLGLPPKGAKRKAYEDATKWANTGEGLKLTDELADELLTENMVVSFIKNNEEMRMISHVLSRGDGIQMTKAVLEMITNLPYKNDKLYAHGDLLFNNRLRKMFEEDALVKMTEDELNLVFGENFLAQFYDELDPESIVAIRSQYTRSVGKQKDRKVQGAEKAKTGKKSNRQTNSNRVRAEEKAEESSMAAKKAAEDMSKPEVIVQEASLEGAFKARQYQLEFEVGPLLGGTVRAFNWVSDKLAMGGKMKTILGGTEHVRKENAATITAELSRFFRSTNRDTFAVNTAFKALQNNTPLNEMPEAQRIIAEPLLQFIDQIFGLGSRNNLDMNGIFADEFVLNLKKMGLSKVAEDITGSAGYADDALGEWWKTIEVGDQNALTIMSKVYSAMQLSRIKPDIADSLRHHFGHTAEGLTYDQAVKLGYKKLADTNPLAKFINVGEKPVLFHPDIIRRMGALNAHLDYERSFKGNYQKIWDKLDPTIGVLKSSLTIWRPGHHMVNGLGGVLFNQLYGVTPHDYARALYLLRARGDTLDIDENSLIQALRAGTPEGYKLKDYKNTVSIFFNGKEQDVPLELLARAGDEIGGTFISARRVKDLPNEVDPENFKIDGWVQRTPGARNIAAMDHGLAKLSAIRDNFFRAALFIRELRRGAHASLEDAILTASQKVHEVHPTVGTLTAGEQKYARRFFYFYTWQKQALFKIMELAANQPAILTVPSKVQYALATGAGLNPESFGDGWDPEGLYASYFTNSVYAPQAIDPVLGAIGVRPASPQLDVIDAFLSKVSVPAKMGFWEAMGELMANTSKGVLVSNSSPLFKIPAELSTGSTMTGQRIDNIGEYLLDQSGLGGITRMTGYTPWGQRSDFKEGEYGVRDRERQFINFLTGIKSTYYQSPASVEIARQELIDYWQRVYKYGKYAEDK